MTEVPVSLTESHDTVTSRFSFGDAVRGLRGIVRLALQKDDYLQDDWVPRESAHEPACAEAARSRPVRTGHW